MSWSCKVRTVTSIEPIENADKIEVVKLGGFVGITPKGQFSVGDLAVLFEPDSIIPDRILEELGLLGKLSGSGKNRVKPVRLRGVLSDGIIVPAPDGASEDDDVQDHFGIVRWEMPVPAELSGKVRSLPYGFRKYDIDNIKNDWLQIAFQNGEEIVGFEKIHGTNVAFGYNKRLNEFYVCSRSQCLEYDKNNLYWQLAERYDIKNKLIEIVNNIEDEDVTFWIHGEGYGPVQDLKYGISIAHFRIFDIRKNDTFLDIDNMLDVCRLYDLQTVPELYRGPYSLAIIEKYAQGDETVSQNAMHVREGIVFRPVKERLDRRGRRVIAKCINPDYLLRKDGTEYH